MTIDKINKLDKVLPKKDIKPVKKSSKAGATDKIEISSKAKELALRNKYIQMIKDSPELDNAEKIEALKGKVGEPDFMTQKIVEDIAQKIAESLGIL